MHNDTKKLVVGCAVGLAALLGLEYVVYQRWNAEVARRRSQLPLPSLSACTALIEAHPNYSSIVALDRPSHNKKTNTLLWPPGTVKLRYPPDALNSRPLECHGRSIRVAIRELAAVK
ncbi:hypothetical protein [Massilia sp. Root351]|jgi:hypothetical protein|uniref:hypothetical protein n=1 Tax=Massilia sp. Root351 TaxID=1736522 RepID=UPI0012F6355C|nr:hypothetical protein [Massilia sp. Root351]